MQQPQPGRGHGEPTPARRSAVKHRHTNDRHECSPGSRPMTLTRRRDSPKLRSIKFECRTRVQCSRGNRRCTVSDSRSSSRQRTAAGQESLQRWANAPIRAWASLTASVPGSTSSVSRSCRSMTLSAHDSVGTACARRRFGRGNIEALRHSDVSGSSGPPSGLRASNATTCSSLSLLNQSAPEWRSDLHGAERVRKPRRAVAGDRAAVALRHTAKPMKQIQREID
jgi:hypothetical protein